MKTFKTLTTIVTAVLLLIVTESVSAQSYDTSTDVTVEANVVSSLSFATQQGTLNFGLIGQDLSSNPATIDPTDGTTSNIIDTEGVSTAKYVLSGTQGQTVAVTYSPATLDHGVQGASEQLDFTADISSNLGEDSDNANGGSTLGSGSGTEILFDGQSDITFWVAGELSATEDGVVSGSYSGDFTLSVDYVD